MSAKNLQHETKLAALDSLSRSHCVCSLCSAGLSLLSITSLCSPPFLSHSFLLKATVLGLQTASAFRLYLYCYGDGVEENMYFSLKEKF